MNFVDTATMTKSALTPNERALLALMQELRHGQIRNLIVRCGDAQFDPPPEVIRRRKLPSRDEPHAETQADDFALKRGVVEFFETLRSLGNGHVEVVKVQDGLPVEIEILDSHRS